MDDKSNARRYFSDEEVLAAGGYSGFWSQQSTAGQIWTAGSDTAKSLLFTVLFKDVYRGGDAGESQSQKFPGKERRIEKHGNLASYGGRGTHC